MGLRQDYAPPDRQAFMRAVQQIGGGNLVAYWPLDEAAGTMAFSVPWTLGADLFDPGAGTFDSGTYSWTKYGNNTIENDAGALKITYVDNPNGAYNYFYDAGDLSANLAVGRLYKLTLSAKVNAGSSVVVIVDDGHGQNVVATVTSTTLQTHTIYFVAHIVSAPTLRAGSMSAGEIIWLDNITLREVLTGEPLTISGCTLGQAGPPQLGRSHYFDGLNDVDSAYIYDDQTGASWGPANHGLCLANGVAFLRTAGVNLSGFAGVEGSSTPFMVVLTDSASKVAWGYVGAQDAAQALGAVKGLTGITKANPGVVTFNAGHGYSNGMLIKFSGLTQMTELNGGYCTLAGQSGDTFQIVNTSTYGAAETTGGNCAEQVTHVGTDGVHIVSTRNGSTRNWAGIEAGFGYNSASYTFQIRRSLFGGNWATGLTVGTWVKPGAIATNWSKIISKQDPPAFVIGQDGTDGQLYGGVYASATPYTATSGVVLANGRWTFVIMVYIPSTSITIYADGVRVAQNTTSIPASLDDTSAPLAIGAKGGLATYFNGNISHAFVIGGKALTASEVKRLYDIGRRAHSG